MSLFEFKPRSTPETDAAVIQQAQQFSPATIKLKGGQTLRQRITSIKGLVEKYLGKYRDEYLCIRDEAVLVEYIDNIISDGAYAIDTETTSLDPISCIIAGISIYSPSNKPAYIPINHVDDFTGLKRKNQLSAEFVKSQFERILHIQPIMFNAKFDMRVLKHQLLKSETYSLTAKFCGYLAARCLNENETQSGLKALHQKYCLNGKGDAFSFDDLFKGIPFTVVPIDIGYLYAAHDAKITWELYEYQKEYLNKENFICRQYALDQVADIFWNIEMPIVEQVAKMEDVGIAIDMEYQQILNEKYGTQLAQTETEFHALCAMHDKEINDWLRGNTKAKMKKPINLSSPLQIAELLYDVLHLTNNSKKEPRSTKEDFIKDIDHPIVKKLLEHRGIEKLMTTYITKMPEILNPITGKIHCSFNQYGAVTGRWSSSEPNMQNIPSENTDIRPMFKAGKGRVLMSSDYSKQELILTAVMARDELMLAGIKEGKDLYSVIAALAFNMSYEDCCETRADGTKNKEGKERRNKAKAIVLGVMYGKGIPAIASDLGITNQAAQDVYNKIMTAFPGLRDFINDSQQMARDYGFVTTFWGRKRRLPDMQLEPYEFSWINGVSNNFDPLADIDEDAPDEVPYDLKARFTAMMNKAFGYKAKQAVKDLAKEENIRIKDNTADIAAAERQCVNSRIQGSAADLTKIAVKLVGESKELAALGFTLVLQIHDELIGECPVENMKECSKIFSFLMEEAGKDLGLPMKCDVEISEKWTGDKIKC